jgi:hypothetical protein
MLPLQHLPCPFCGQSMLHEFDTTHSVVKVDCGSCGRLVIPRVPVDPKKGFYEALLKRPESERRALGVYFREHRDGTGSAVILEEKHYRTHLLRAGLQ